MNMRSEKTVRRLNEDPGPHHRKFWKLVKNLRRRPAPIPVIRTDDGPLVTPAEKCEAFAQHFQDIPSIAPSYRSRGLDASVGRSVEGIRSVLLAGDEVPTVMRRAVGDGIRFLRNGKAPEFDGITAQHLRHMPPGAILLTLILSEVKY